MGAPKERNYVHAPTIQPSIINQLHLPSLQEGESLPMHEKFE
jgi:hypothetical protein